MPKVKQNGVEFGRGAGYDQDGLEWTHGRAPVRDTPFGNEFNIAIHYVDCLPPEGTKHKGTILLIHGFPQTWYQFRHVISPFAKAGYRTIAADYRGAGESTKTLTLDGFTKQSMSEDLHILVTKCLGISEPVHVVGHDIGAMVAHAYAVQFPADTASIVWGECPLPGSEVYYATRHDRHLWHFTFHAVPDLPEQLIAGKERQYIKHFFDRVCQNPEGVTPTDIDHYASSFCQPGGVRCALDTYRAFDLDAADNKKWVEEKGKCPVRCMALWGEKSFANRDKSDSMCGQFYTDYEFAAVEKSGHWIAEEQPRAFYEIVLKWVEKKS